MHNPHSQKKVDSIMKKFSFYLLLIFLSVSFYCCSQEKVDERRILARINDYSLFLDQFQYQMARKIDLDKDFKLTDEAKREFLEEIIRKELLIQEAKKFKLDRKEKFVRSIERYWESTLIRDVIDLKSKEIDRRAYVSQKEIDARYSEMRKSNEKLPPLKAMHEKISKELKEKRKTKMLKEWINDLRKNATIETYQELL